MKKHTLTKSSLIWLLFFVQLSVQATVRYVVSGNSVSNFGTSWASANGNLQTMINASASGDSIWVAAGIYKPSAYPSACTGCSSSRDYTFSMREGVMIFGGFNSYDSWGNRNPKLKQTILDGNIGSLFSSSDNVHHVVLAVGVDFFKLDGFKIRNGNGDESTSITVNKNSVNKTINRNRGAAIFQVDCNYGTIVNCEIYNNEASQGAGLYLVDCEPVGAYLERVVLRNNTAQSFGGAVSLFNSRVVASSSLFYLNSAASSGKAIDGFFQSDIEVSFCTFYLNTTSSTASLINVESSSICDVNASIIWDNYTSSSTASIYTSSTSSTYLYNNIIEGGVASCSSCPAGDGDIDPEFINSADPNGIDNIFGTDDDGLVLKACSPGIDYPLSPGFYTFPSFDVTSRNRSNDFNLDNPEVYDLGAYERYLGLENEKIYVNTNLVTGLNNGTSAANAFSGSTGLQNALVAASTKCNLVDILVAQGIYRPSSYPAGCVGCSSVSDYTFVLPPNASIIGSYDPTFTLKDERFYPVYLDGNVGSFADSLDNAHHILLTIKKIGQANKIESVTFRNGGNPDFAPGTNNSTTIEVNGLTIARNRGGAIYSRNAGTALESCTFENNHVAGGVLYLYLNSIIYGNLFNKLTFRNNVSIPYEVSPGSYQVSSLINGQQSEFTFQSSSFYNNTSTYEHATLDFYLTGSTVNIYGSKFYNNKGTLFDIYNTDFSINTSLIYNHQGSGLSMRVGGEGTYNTLISHCDFVYPNSGDFAVEVMSGNLTVENSVLWNTNSVNSAIYLNPAFSGTMPSVSNSIIKNGWAGCTNCPGGNGNIDPQFKNINTLFGEHDADESFDDGLMPQVTSPLVDAGSYSGPLYRDIVGRPAFAASDIGAYESFNTGFCNTNWYLTDKTLPSGDYNAFERVISESHISNTSDVTMGGESILLLPGFETSSGAVFVADPDERCIGL